MKTPIITSFTANTILKMSVEKAIPAEGSTGAVLAPLPLL